MTEGVTVNADVNVVIECSEVIDRPADAVWKAVRGLQAIMVPAGVTEQAESDMLPADDVPAQSLRASEQLSMEQRVAEIDDVLMLLRMEMTSGRNLPWSSYQSRVRIEPVGPYRARTTMTCLATPTAEPQMVEGVLKRLTLLSLQSLKERLQSPK